MVLNIDNILYNKVNIFNILIVIFSIFIISTKNINFFTLTIIFFVFVIQQILIIKFKNSKKNDNKISYKNLDHIKKTIKENLLYRSNMINSNKMTIEKWVEYNNNNMNITIDNEKFYFFIWEYIPKQDEFILLVHPYTDFVNMVFSDYMKDRKEVFPHIKEEPNDKNVHNMYRIADLDKVNLIKYYWTDPLKESLVKKESYFVKWIDKENNKSGVIGIGYNINNMLKTNTISYSNYINYSYLIFLNFIISIVTYITFAITKHKVKSLLILIISFTYITRYIDSQELLGSFTTENLKIENLNSSILGVSFLVGMNIFILSSLKKDIKIKLFIESGIIFSMSLILLLFSMIKFTNYMNIRELMENRISNQIMFNFSILLNLFVIINYILFVVTRENKFLLKYI